MSIGFYLEKVGDVFRFPWLCPPKTKYDSTDVNQHVQSEIHLQSVHFLRFACSVVGKGKHSFSQMGAGHTVMNPMVESVDKPPLTNLSLQVSGCTHPDCFDKMWCFFRAVFFTQTLGWLTGSLFHGLSKESAQINWIIWIALIAFNLDSIC